MDLTLNGNVEMWVELLLNAGAVILPFMILIVLTSLGGASAVKSGRVLWRNLRNQLPPAVDQPSDPVVQALVALAKVAKIKGATPEAVSSVASDVVEYIITVVDKALEDPAPESASKATVGGAVPRA